MKKRKIRILGINFFNGSVQDAVNEICKGGYIVMPAAPALVTMPYDPIYADAIIKSDIAIADSRYMVLMWFFLKREKVKRISGLTFLLEFLKILDLQESKSLFLVDPSEEESNSNKKFLKSKGIFLRKGYSYIAPYYGNTVEDYPLVKIFNRLKPKYILLNIGGGKQEKLAYFLLKNLSYRPSIICTGAAIAFLSGKQAFIPGWADRIGLGWLWRCIDEPKKFIPRYLSAFSLFSLMAKFGSKRPRHLIS